MKYSITALTVLGALVSTVAYADNVSVENAIKNRADLSTFYQALVNTGVNRELSENRRYTVFAPTNEAFARIRQDSYPCFYMTACRAEVAQILRNHIVPGDVYMADAVKQKGGVFSISNRKVNVSEPFRNDYAVDGQNVLYTSWFNSGILYKIDGVIANPRELSSLQFPDYAYLQGREVTTTTQKTIPDPSCAPEGCPDRVTETTTITRPLLSPAR